MNLPAIFKYVNPEILYLMSYKLWKYIQADGDLLYENEDLVCGILPNTPAKSNKIQIFED